MNGFFSELRRRKVYRVAAAYGVVAWGIIQFAATVFPAWELPGWALRLVITIVLLGFPVSLIMAWAFDLTPDGLEPEQEPVTGSGGSRLTIRRRGNFYLLGGFGVVVATVAGFFLLPRASADRVEKSIAVLPFENLSSDAENAYFADGIQDDILTNLAKIGDLKVISRTSVMPYRGKANNLREIGRALGVSAILEGSVRKSGNRVRVNVQLINTANDEHLWAEDYDRDLTDVFAIQTDLAQNIAKALQAKLSPSEKAQMTRKPTENGEAYLAFVQAHNLGSHYDDGEKLKLAEQLYDRAMQLDPSFALAIAAASRLQSWFFHTGDPTAARRDRARMLAERALQLEPDLPEAHLALGFSLYYGDQNYNAALREFSTAQQGLPNQSEVYLAIGAIQRRQGRWAESTANLEKAASLDPNNVWPLQNLASNYQMTRNFKAVVETVDRGLKLDPTSFTLWSIKAQSALEERDAARLEEAIAKLSEVEVKGAKQGHAAMLRIHLLVTQRKWMDALHESSKLVDEQLTRLNAPDVLVSKHLTEGIVRQRLQQEEEARAALLKAKTYAERFVREAPDDPKRHLKLSHVLAYLGEKEAAIAEARRAVELRPETIDAFEGPVMTQGLAEVYAVVGDNDRAIDLLEGLLSRPSDMTVSLLESAPVWDTMRDQPRFRALVEKHRAQT